MKNRVAALVTLFILVKLCAGEITVCLNGDKHVDSEVLDEEMPDELHLDYLKLNFSHPAISVNGYIQNVTVTNLKDYEMHGPKLIDRGHYQVFRLRFHNIPLKGIYSIEDGNIGGLFDIFGHGDFWMNLIGFQIFTYGAIPPTINATGLCQKVGVDIDLAEEKGYFSHFMNDPEIEGIINRAINTLLPEIFPMFWGELKTWNHDEIEKVVNDLVNKKRMGRDIIRAAYEYQSTANKMST